MRNLFLIEFIFLSFLFISCKDEPSPPLLRVQNVDTVDFDDVRVASYNFGPLASGEISEFIEVEEVYDVYTTFLRYNGQECYILVPDHLGATPKSKGKFRYEVRIAPLPNSEACSVEYILVKE